MWWDLIVAAPVPPPDSITSRVQRALDEVVRVADLGRLLLEDADELGADRLALGLGLAQPLQPREEALLAVDGHERDLELVAERGDHLLALVLAHHPVVHEHARQLVADRAVDEQRGDARVHAAGQRADHLAAADLGADRGDLLLDDVRRAPGARAAADVLEERRQHVLAVGRVDDLGVELDAVQAARRRPRPRRPATPWSSPAR